MAEVNSVVLKYAARGADKARRKDRQVREGISRTARKARKEQGTIKKWMSRHKTALMAIGAAAAGAIGMIIKNSPTLSGELASVRLGFSLLAMTVGEDVAPALEWVGDLVLDLEEGFADLDPSIRKPISALIVLSFAAGAAALALAALQTVVGGTVIARGLVWIGGAAWAAAGGLTAFATTVGLAAALLAGAIAVVIGAAVAIGFIAAEMVGVTDKTEMGRQELGDFRSALWDLIFVLAGPFLAVLGIAFAFWEGGWQNAKRVAHRYGEEIFKSFMRLAVRLGAGIHALAATIHTGMEVAWDKAVDATKSGANAILSTVESLVNRAVRELNKLPEVNLEGASFDKFDTEGAVSIQQRGAERLRSRLSGIRSKRTQQLERFAAEEIDHSGPAGSGGPTAGGETVVEDRSRTVEQLTIEVQGTGSEEIDAELLAERTSDELASDTGSRGGPNHVT